MVIALSNYDQRAGQYGLLDQIFFQNDEHTPRRAMLGLLPRGKIKMLEMCFGTGENLALIARHRPDVRITGIDLLEVGVKCTERRRWRR